MHKQLPDIRITLCATRAMARRRMASISEGAPLAEMYRRHLRCGRGPRGGPRNVVGGPLGRGPAALLAMGVGTLRGVARGCICCRPEGLLVSVAGADAALVRQGSTALFYRLPP